MTEQPKGYQATPELERELAGKGQASLRGGRYVATVVSAGRGYFEAYTDSQPFVYGLPASTLQGALDNLEGAVCKAEAQRRAS